MKYDYKYYTSFYVGTRRANVLGKSLKQPNLALRSKQLRQYTLYV